MRATGWRYRLVCYFARLKLLIKKGKGLKYKSKIFEPDSGFYFGAIIPVLSFSVECSSVCPLIYIFLFRITALDASGSYGFAGTNGGQLYLWELSSGRKLIGVQCFNRKWHRTMSWCLEECRMLECQNMIYSYKWVGQWESIFHSNLEWSHS